jgi:hypothetical protein
VLWKGRLIQLCLHEHKCSGRVGWSSSAYGTVVLLLLYICPWIQVKYIHLTLNNNQPLLTKCQLICLSHSRRAHLQSEHLCNLLSWTIIKYNWYLWKDSWGKKEKQAWYISYCRCDLRRGKLSLKKIKKKKVNNALSFHRKNLFCNNTSKRRQYNSINIMVDCYLTSNGCISPVFMDRYTTTVTRRCHKRSWINLPFQSTCVHARIQLCLHEHKCSGRVGWSSFVYMNTSALEG